MIRLYDEQEKKIKYMENILEDYISEESEENITIQELIKLKFIGITPPEEEEERTKYITLNSFGMSGGCSRKPGNIVLNINNLVDIIPDIILTTSGVTSSNKFLLVTAAVKVWSTLWGKSKIDINQDHALVLYALWKNRNSNNKIEENLGYLKSNEIRKNLKNAELTTYEYSYIINDLVKIQSIEIDNGVIWLRESVKINY